MVVDILQAIGTILLLGLPVWVPGIWATTRRDTNRIAKVLGRPSDPASAEELAAALVTRRCGVRLWRDLLFGFLRFDQPLVPYPWARVAVWPGRLAIRLPRAGDYRFRSDNSRVQTARSGFWLAWYAPDETILRMRIYVPGHRRNVLAGLQTAGWDVKPRDVVGA